MSRWFGSRWRKSTPIPSTPWPARMPNGGRRPRRRPGFVFWKIVGKIAYIASLVMKLGYMVAAAVGIGLIADAISRRWFGRQIDWASMLDSATSFGWVQLALIAVLLILIRRIVIRLNMPDT